MSWFGLGGGSKKDDNTEKVMKIDDSFDNNNSYVTNNTDSSYYSQSSNLGSTSSLGSNSFEQELIQEQQKAMIQAVMFKLTEASFDACVTKPSSSLSYSEQSCISAVVGKYLDTSELVVTRFQNSSQ